MDKKAIEKKLEDDLRSYINDPSSVKPYAQSMKVLDQWLSELKKVMKILCTDTYEQELKKILEPMAKENFEDTKKFKIYLDTIIINIPTKVTKYKQSIYFYDENVKDIEYENYTIIFYHDEFNDSYVVLSILEK